MDAFENIVASILDRNGYWTRTEFKVDLTASDKKRIGRPSTPRWEIDVIAYKANTNRILAVECKSYLDSTGVRTQAFAEPGSQHGRRFKLFNESTTRRIVLSNLAAQLESNGLCRPNPDITLCLAAGKVRNADDLDYIQNYFNKRDWQFFSPDWIRSELGALAKSGYENSTAAVTTKLLLRE